MATSARCPLTCNTQFLDPHRNDGFSGNGPVYADMVTACSEMVSFQLSETDHTISEFGASLRVGRRDQLNSEHQHMIFAPSAFLEKVLFSTLHTFVVPLTLGSEVLYDMCRRMLEI